MADNTTVPWMQSRLRCRTTFMDQSAPYRVALGIGLTQFI